MTNNEAEIDGVSPQGPDRAAADDLAGSARASAGHIKQASAPQSHPATPRGGAGWLAMLALLGALAALAGVGWLHWQWIYGPSPLAPRLADLEQRLAAIPPAQTPSLDLPAVRREIERAGAELRDFLDAELDARSGQATTDASNGNAQEPPRARDWQLAEARYLLRMANHRLLLERDVAGAAALLQAADAVLVELDDFALHAVRAEIAVERLALESLPAFDVEGLFLQLEAIKRELEQLPLRLPALQPPSPDSPPATGWDAIRAEIDQLIRFRRVDGAAARPLLAPEEAVHLELNLRLMLERAQLAGLRREQAIYDQSIAAARDWIERYLDRSIPAVQRILEGLSGLGAVELAAPLPDISGSLNALQALQGSNSPAAASAAVPNAAAPIAPAPDAAAPVSEPSP